MLLIPINTVDMIGRFMRRGAFKSLFFSLDMDGFIAIKSTKAVNELIPEAPAPSLFPVKQNTALHASL